MPDERMNLLTLDRWGAANLDKWWKKMGMNSSSGEETDEKNGAVSSRKNGDDIGKALVPVGITNRD